MFLLQEVEKIQGNLGDSSIEKVSPVFPLTIRSIPPG